MTIATLDADILLAQDEFRALNREHWNRVHRGTWYRQSTGYHAISAAKERRLVELAETIARLRRFRSLLHWKAFARNYASDSG